MNRENKRKTCRGKALSSCSCKTALPLESPSGALIAACEPPPFFESSLGQHKKENALPGIRQDVFLFMDLEGFEPLTSRMRTERSPS